MKQTSQIVVIGGGPAGRAVALAASARRHVTLVDEYATAGAPTLERLMMGAFVRTARNRSNFDDAQMAALAVRETYLNQLPEKRALQNAGVAVITGQAELVSDTTVQIGHDLITARNIVIATGSQTVLPKVTGWDKPLGIGDLFYLKRLAKRLAVLGFDPSIESLLKAFKSLGARVTIISDVPNPDTDLATIPATIGSMEKLQRSYRINLHTIDATASLGADVIVAVGKNRPSLDLGLDQANLDHNEGGIITNRHFQTSNRRIYAVGSCARSNGSKLSSEEQGRQVGRKLA